MNIKRIIAATILATASITANADFYSGKTLLANFDKGEPGIDLMMGYIAGVSDYGSVDGVICVPNGTVMGEMGTRVREDLASMPDYLLALTADILVGESLARRYPCPMDGKGAFYTGGKLLDKAATTDAYMAMGYVAGTLDSAITDGLLCFTEWTTIGQATVTAFKYLGANPGTLDYPAALTITRAWYEIAPCDKGLRQ